VLEQAIVDTADSGVRIEFGPLVRSVSARLADESDGVVDAATAVLRAVRDADPDYSAHVTSLPAALADLTRRAARPMATASARAAARRSPDRRQPGGAAVPAGSRSSSPRGARRTAVDVVADATAAANPRRRGSGLGSTAVRGGSLDTAAQRLGIGTVRLQGEGAAIVAAAPFLADEGEDDGEDGGGAGGAGHRVGASRRHAPPGALGSPGRLGRAAGSPTAMASPTAALGSARDRGRAGDPSPRGRDGRGAGGRSPPGMGQASPSSPIRSPALVRLIGAAAVDALASTGDKEEADGRAAAASALASALADADPATAAAAARPVAEALASLLADPVFRVAMKAFEAAQAAAAAMGHRLSPHLDAVLPPLRSRLADTTMLVRHAALRTFGGIMRGTGPGPVVAATLRLLQHRRSLVRDGAVRVLVMALIVGGAAADPDAIAEAAAPLLSDPNARVTADAVELLVLAAHVAAGGGTAALEGRGAAAAAPTSVPAAAASALLDTLEARAGVDRGSAPSELLARRLAAHDRPLPSLTPDGFLVMPADGRGSRNGSSSSSRAGAAPARSPGVAGGGAGAANGTGRPGQGAEYQSAPVGGWQRGVRFDDDVERGPGGRSSASPGRPAAAGAAASGADRAGVAAEPARPARVRSARVGGRKARPASVLPFEVAQPRSVSRRGTSRSARRLRADTATSSASGPGLASPTAPPVSGTGEGASGFFSEVVRADGTTRMLAGDGPPSAGSRRGGGTPMEIESASSPGSYAAPSRDGGPRGHGAVAPGGFAVLPPARSAGARRSHSARSGGDASTGATAPMGAEPVRGSTGRNTAATVATVRPDWLEDEDDEDDDGAAPLAAGGPRRQRFHSSSAPVSPRGATGEQDGSSLGQPPGLARAGSRSTSPSVAGGPRVQSSHPRTHDAASPLRLGAAASLASGYPPYGGAGAGAPSLPGGSDHESIGSADTRTGLSSATGNSAGPATDWEWLAGHGGEARRGAGAPVVAGGVLGSVDRPAPRAAHAGAGGLASVLSPGSAGTAGSPARGPGGAVPTPQRRHQAGSRLSRAGASALGGGSASDRARRHQSAGVRRNRWGDDDDGGGGDGASRADATAAAYGAPSGGRGGKGAPLRRRVTDSPTEQGLASAGGAGGGQRQGDRPRRVVSATAHGASRRAARLREQQLAVDERLAMLGAGGGAAAGAVGRRRTESRGVSSRQRGGGEASSPGRGGGVGPVRSLPIDGSSGNDPGSAAWLRDDGGGSGPPVAHAGLASPGRGGKAPLDATAAPEQRGPARPRVYHDPRRESWEEQQGAAGGRRQMSARGTRDGGGPPAGRRALAQSFTPDPHRTVPRRFGLDAQDDDGDAGAANGGPGGFDPERGADGSDLWGSPRLEAPPPPLSLPGLDPSGAPLDPADRPIRPMRSEEPYGRAGEPDASPIGSPEERPIRPMRNPGLAFTVAGDGGAPAGPSPLAARSGTASRASTRTSASSRARERVSPVTVTAASPPRAVHAGRRPNAPGALSVGGRRPGTGQAAPTSSAPSSTRRLARAGTADTAAASDDGTEDDASSARASSRPRAGGSVGAGHSPARSAGVPSVALETKYTEFEDLEPLRRSPAAAIARAVADLTSKDWQRELAGLDAVRRLSKHHADVLGPSVSAIARACVPAANSLRSSVSKTAIMAVGELAVALGRALDGDLDFLIPHLLRKSADTSDFIAVEAESTLHHVLGSCGSTRTLGALLHASKHKATVIRLSAARWLAELGIAMGDKLAGLRNLDDVVAAAARYVGEGKEVARHAGKRLLLVLHGAGALRSGTLERVVGDRTARNLRGVIEKLEGRGGLAALESSPSGGSTASAATGAGGVAAGRAASRRKSRAPSRASSRGGADSRASAAPRPRSGTEPIPDVAGHRPVSSEDAERPVVPRGGGGAASRGASRRGASRQRGRPGSTSRGGAPSASSTARAGSAFVPMGDELKAVLDRLGDSEWRTRLGALDALLALAERDPSSVRSNAAAAVDEAARRVGDGNIKVATAAVAAVRRLAESPALHGGALEAAVPVLFPPLATATANRQKVIASGAVDIIDRVLAAVDAKHTIAPLVSAIVSGNSTVRGVLLARLAALVGAAHKSRPGLVQRAVLPKLWPLLDDSRLDTRNGATAAVQAAAKAMGKDAVLKAASATGGRHSAAVDRALE